MTITIRPREASPSPGRIMSFKAYPQSWYLVCRSIELPRGAVMSRSLLGHPIVLFRSASGSVHALAAHCSHMGTHLGGGTVVGECLRCPLHHFMFEGDGRSRLPGMGQRSWPVVERFGGVFVFLGHEALFEVPSFAASSSEELCTRVGRTVFINCSWIGIVSNAYDMQHLNAVHERALREPPIVESLDRYRLQLRYLSRVTGHGLSDRTMKWLSRDHIRVSITCWGGTLFTVESNLGRRTSMLLLSLLPTKEGVEITPIFAMKKTGFAPLDWFRLKMASWLFTGFLEKDVAIMRSMRFKAPATNLPQEEPLRRFLSYLDSLPESPGGFDRMEGPCPRD